MKPSFPELYDLETRGFDRDIPFYLRRLERTRGPVLELGAGTGRVSLPLLAAGHTVVALDRDEGMLARLAEKAEAALPDEALARLTVVHGDATAFRLKERFAAVIAPYNFLYTLPGDGPLHDCLAAVRRALAPRGTALFSVFNPDPARLAPDAARTLVATGALGDGATVEVFETRAYDRATQILAVRRVYELDRAGKRSAMEREIRQHIVHPRDLLFRLRHEKFKIKATWGDHDDRPFAGNCANLLVAAGKGAER